MAEGNSPWPPAMSDPLELAQQIEHDVRSPLTAICSYAECLAWMTTLDPATRDRYARSVVCETKRVSRMLADHSLLAGCRRDGPLAEVDPRVALHDAVAEVVELADLRGVQVRVEARPQDRSLHWMPVLLGQLLTAAVETVVVSAREQTSVDVILTDEGAGHLTLQVLTPADELRPLAVKTLSCQVVEVILAECGGTLTLLGGPQMGLALAIPWTGRGSAAPEAPGLVRLIS